MSLYEKGYQEPFLGEGPPIGHILEKFHPTERYLL